MENPARVFFPTVELIVLIRKIGDFHEKGGIELFPYRLNMGHSFLSSAWFDSDQDLPVIRCLAHIRKIKETETGGKPTPLTEPVYLKMENNDNFFGFYDSKGICPIQDLAKGHKEATHTALKKPMAEIIVDNHYDFESNKSFYDEPAEIPPF